MGGSIFLQVFFGVNIFLMGALAAVAARHAYAHFRPEHHEPERPAPKKPTLPPAVKQRLLERAETDYRRQLDQSTGQLQRELDRTVVELNKQLAGLGDHIIQDEMKRYKTTLDELRQHTEATLSQTQLTIAAHQKELDAKIAEQQTALQAQLEADMAAEKQRLIEQLDNKLADAVTSFLAETLEHNADMGAQADYLMDMLEAHKEDFKQEIGGGPTATK